MTIDQIKKIIEEKNEAREQEVLYDAGNIIDEITKLQQMKQNIDEKILEYQKTLKELSFTPINPSAIL